MGVGAVDKVVDVVVTAMSMGVTLHDLEDLDLAYAPPFSKAIHPLVHTVNVMFNKLKGAYEIVTPEEYTNGETEGYTILDACLVPTLEGKEYLDLQAPENYLNVKRYIKETKQLGEKFLNERFPNYYAKDITDEI